MAFYTLSNRSGDTLIILQHGASLQRWSVRLGNTRRELILGYPAAQHYQHDSCYLGAVVGPYANRIGGGVLQLDNQRHQLQQNEGQHHLHGGSQGLHQRNWQLLEQQASRLVLACDLADGHSGYPGPLRFIVTYQLSDNGTLEATLQAWAEQPSLIGPTLHPYFNLAAGQPVIDQHQLWLAAEQYTLTDGDKIPTGELRQVQGSKLDFSRAKALDGIRLDHNFVVHGNLQQAAAELTSPDQRLRLKVSSDYPGLQVYTGEHLGAPFLPRQGICLEPQFFPDSPNQPGFPFHFTRPEQAFVAHIRYQLEKG